jgi:hypothetical protein
VNNSGSRWVRSGLAWLTGPAGGPPDYSRSGILTRAESVAGELSARLAVSVDATAALTGRAALLGLTRRGRISAGGAARLMATRDGWCALTLSRPDDVAAVPALVETNAVPDDPWPTVLDWAARQSSTDVIERAVLLDLPVARLGETLAESPRVTVAGSPTHPRPVAGLLVADLSSMWAGPLCGQILGAAGATVVKVESPGRPDGTRSGDKAFYDWINHGKLSYAIDFDDNRLRALLSVADVVIEGSRPAALARRGVSPQSVPGPRGRVWLRITGQGADSPRVAFGDDAAVAGGLVGTGVDGPVFCADAVADPLTGLEAALSVANSVCRGGGEVIDVVMARVAATYAALPVEPAAGPMDPQPPQPPPAAPPAAGLGADNDRVDAIVAQRLSVTC